MPFSTKSNIDEMKETFRKRFEAVSKEVGSEAAIPYFDIKESGGKFELSVFGEDKRDIYTANFDVMYYNGLKNGGMGSNNAVFIESNSGEIGLHGVVNVEYGKNGKITLPGGDNNNPNTTGMDSYFTLVSLGYIAKLRDMRSNFGENLATHVQNQIHSGYAGDKIFAEAGDRFFNRGTSHEQRRRYASSTAVFASNTSGEYISPEEMYDRISGAISDRFQIPNGIKVDSGHPLMLMPGFAGTPWRENGESKIYSVKGAELKAYMSFARDENKQYQVLKGVVTPLEQVKGLENIYTMSGLQEDEDQDRGYGFRERIFAPSIIMPVPGGHGRRVISPETKKALGKGHIESGFLGVRNIDVPLFNGKDEAQGLSHEEIGKQLQGKVKINDKYNRGTIGLRVGQGRSVSPITLSLAGKSKAQAIEATNRPVSVNDFSVILPYSTKVRTIEDGQIKFWTDEELDVKEREIKKTLGLHESVKVKYSSDISSGVRFQFGITQLDTASIKSGMKMMPGLPLMGVDQAFYEPDQNGKMVKRQGSDFNVLAENKAGANLIRSAIQAQPKKMAAAINDIYNVSLPTDSDVFNMETALSQLTQFNSKEQLYQDLFDKSMAGGSAFQNKYGFGFERGWVPYEQYTTKSLDSFRENMYSALLHPELLSNAVSALEKGGKLSDEQRGRLASIKSFIASSDAEKRNILDAEFGIGKEKNATLRGNTGLFQDVMRFEKSEVKIGKDPSEKAPIYTMFINTPGFAGDFFTREVVEYNSGIKKFGLLDSAKMQNFDPRALEFMRQEGVVSSASPAKKNVLSMLSAMQIMQQNSVNGETMYIPQAGWAVMGRDEGIDDSLLFSDEPGSNSIDRLENMAKRIGDRGVYLPNSRLAFSNLGALMANEQRITGVDVKTGEGVEHSISHESDFMKLFQEGIGIEKSLSDPNLPEDQQRSLMFRAGDIRNRLMTYYGHRATGESAYADDVNFGIFGRYGGTGLLEQGKIFITDEAIDTFSGQAMDILNQFKKATIAESNGQITNDDFKGINRRKVKSILRKNLNGIQAFGSRPPDTTSSSVDINGNMYLGSPATYDLVTEDDKIFRRVMNEYRKNKVNTGAHMFMSMYEGYTQGDLDADPLRVIPYGMLKFNKNEKTNQYEVGFQKFDKDISYDDYRNLATESLKHMTPEAAHDMFKRIRASSDTSRNPLVNSLAQGLAVAFGDSGIPELSEAKNVIEDQFYMRDKLKAWNLNKSVFMGTEYNQYQRTMLAAGIAAGVDPILLTDTANEFAQFYASAIDMERTEASPLSRISQSLSINANGGKDHLFANFGKENNTIPINNGGLLATNTFFARAVSDIANGGNGNGSMSDEQISQLITPIPEQNNFSLNEAKAYRESIRQNAVNIGKSRIKGKFTEASALSLLQQGKTGWDSILGQTLLNAFYEKKDNPNNPVDINDLQFKFSGGVKKFKEIAPILQLANELKGLYKRSSRNDVEGKLPEAMQMRNAIQAYDTAMTHGLLTDPSVQQLFETAFPGAKFARNGAITNLSEIYKFEGMEGLTDSEKAIIERAKSLSIENELMPTGHVANQYIPASLLSISEKVSDTDKDPYNAYMTNNLADIGAKLGIPGNYRLPGGVAAEAGTYGEKYIVENRFSDLKKLGYGHSTSIDGENGISRSMFGFLRSGRSLNNGFTSTGLVDLFGISKNKNGGVNIKFGDIKFLGKGTEAEKLYSGQLNTYKAFWEDAIRTGLGQRSVNGSGNERAFLDELAQSAVAEGTFKDEDEFYAALSKERNYDMNLLVADMPKLAEGEIGRGTVDNPTPTEKAIQAAAGKLSSKKVGEITSDELEQKFQKTESNLQEGRPMSLRVMTELWRQASETPYSSYGSKDADAAARLKELGIDAHKFAKESGQGPAQARAQYNVLANELSNIPGNKLTGQSVSVDEKDNAPSVLPASMSNPAAGGTGGGGTPIGNLSGNSQGTPVYIVGSAKGSLEDAETTSIKTLQEVADNIVDLTKALGARTSYPAANSKYLTGVGSDIASKLDLDATYLSESSVTPGINEMAQRFGKGAFVEELRKKGLNDTQIAMRLEQGLDLEDGGILSYSPDSDARVKTYKKRLAFVRNQFSGEKTVSAIGAKLSDVMGPEATTSELLNATMNVAAAKKMSWSEDFEKYGIDKEKYNSLVELNDYIESANPNKEKWIDEITVASMSQGVLNSRRMNQLQTFAMRFGQTKSGIGEQIALQKKNLMNERAGYNDSLLNLSGSEFMKYYPDEIGRIANNEATQEDYLRLLQAPSGAEDQISHAKTLQLKGVLGSIQGASETFNQENELDAKRRMAVRDIRRENIETNSTWKRAEGNVEHADAVRGLTNEYRSAKDAAAAHAASLIELDKKTKLLGETLVTANDAIKSVNNGGSNIPGVAKTASEFIKLTPEERGNQIKRLSDIAPDVAGQLAKSFEGYSEAYAKEEKEAYDASEAKGENNFAGMTRKILGGFGLMYLRSMGNLILSGSETGYNERVKADEMLNKVMGGYMGGTGFMRNPEDAVMNNLTTIGGGGMRTLRYIQSELTNSATSGLGGAAVAGLGGFALTQQFAPLFKMLGATSSAMGPIGLAIGGTLAVGSLLLNSAAAQNDPLGTAVTSAAANNKFISQSLNAGTNWSQLSQFEQLGTTISQAVNGAGAVWSELQVLSNQDAQAYQQTFAKGLGALNNGDTINLNDMVKYYSQNEKSVVKSAFAKTLLSNGELSKYPQESVFKAFGLFARYMPEFNLEQLKNTAGYITNGVPLEELITKTSSASGLGFSDAEKLRENLVQQISYTDNMSAAEFEQAVTGAERYEALGAGREFIRFKQTGSNIANYSIVQREQKLAEMTSGEYDVFSKNAQLSASRRRAGLKFEPVDIDSYIGMTVDEYDRQYDEAIVNTQAQSRYDNTAYTIGSYMGIENSRKYLLGKYGSNLTAEQQNVASDIEGTRENIIGNIASSAGMYGNMTIDEQLAYRNSLYGQSNQSLRMIAMSWNNRTNFQDNMAVMGFNSYQTGVFGSVYGQGSVLQQSKNNQFISNGMAITQNLMMNYGVSEAQAKQIGNQAMLENSTMSRMLMGASQFDQSSLMYLQSTGVQLPWQTQAIDARQFTGEIGQFGYMAGKPTGLSLFSTTMNIGNPNMPGGISGSKVAETLFGANWKTSSQNVQMAYNSVGDKTGLLEGMINGIEIGGKSLIDGSPLKIGGIAAANYMQAQQNYQNALASAGVSMKGWQINYDFTTGIGLGNYKTINPVTGQPFNIPAGGEWGLQDRQNNLQWAQQEFSMGMNERQFAMQNNQWYQNFSLNMRGTMMQRGWQQEDWAVQDQTRSLQWAWKQQDYNEELRFMTGRQRRLAERQHGRDVIGHDIEEEQIDRQKSRQKETWKLEDDRFSLQKKQYEEQKKLQQESLDKQREFYEEKKKLEKESLELQRAQWVESMANQKAGIGLQAQQAKNALEMAEVMARMEEHTRQASVYQEQLKIEAGKTSEISEDLQTVMGDVMQLMYDKAVDIMEVLDGEVNKNNRSGKPLRNNTSSIPSSVGNGDNTTQTQSYNPWYNPSVTDMNPYDGVSTTPIKLVVNVANQHFATMIIDTVSKEITL